MKPPAAGRRDRLRAMLADLRMPGALEAVDGICGATNKMRSAELTGAGESVRVRREGKANHYFHREPCGGIREGVDDRAKARALAHLDGLAWWMVDRRGADLQC